MPTHIVADIEAMQKMSADWRRQNLSIGFVPTMGFLHQGHASLMRSARASCDVVVTSIFVNPTQFGANEDFDKYPRDFENDRRIAEEAGADVLFAPTAEAMYPNGHSTTVKAGKEAEPFEGARRPGHFDGVATIVAKLFNAVCPDVAFFGQKDYQQTIVVQRLTADLNFPVRIAVEPTVRESNGLAMSSRNVYLSDRQRQTAGCIYQALQEAKTARNAGENNRIALQTIMHRRLAQADGILPEYAEAAAAATLQQPDEFLPNETVVLLIAAQIGSTRLIDNMLCTPTGKLP